MGKKYDNWLTQNKNVITSLDQLSQMIIQQRKFSEIDKLSFNDKSLDAAFSLILNAINTKKKIALYGDYDVDGTMSCVSWIWFLRSINYNHFTYYIPNRQTEGYGVNLKAIQDLVKKEHVDLIITMDCGITANKEAAWCKENNVDFLCTDHHEIQPDNMPDCTILNPKLHPDPLYQQLCGCGITFVLLRRLGQSFSVPHELWIDLLALAGMATICDMVPLNVINHKIAKLGVNALKNSNRVILQRLLEVCSLNEKEVNETDVGFRLGPRINAVGRLDHGHKIVRAFIHNDIEPLLTYMNTCNEDRKKIQFQIINEAMSSINDSSNDPLVFMGGHWHVGVVGIAASRVVEETWKPAWLYSKKDDIYRGSARSIPGFDITKAMSSISHLFISYGGHKGAGGFAFHRTQESHIRKGLQDYINTSKKEQPSDIWKSSITYDCEIDTTLLTLNLVHLLDKFRPFGYGFPEPLFLIRAKIHHVRFYHDKVTKEKKHTAVTIKTSHTSTQKIIFFNAVYTELKQDKKALFLVTINKNYWQKRVSVSLIGSDYVIQGE